MKNKSDEPISSLLIDNQLITSAKHIFTSIADKINRNVVKPKQPQLLHLDPEKNNTICLSPTVPEDIEELTSSTKSSKASCPNSIPTNICKLFKKFSKHLSE